jgi:hypothetical protein
MAAANANKNYSLREGATLRGGAHGHAAVSVNGGAKKDEEDFVIRVLLSGK